MKKLNKKGFTLVELVIVIAVIAILAAVLIPVFSSIISNAKESKSLQNAKNAWTEYVVSRGDKFEGTEAGYIVSTDGYVFTIANGNIVVPDNDYSTTAPTAHTIIEVNDWDTATQGTTYYVHQAPINGVNIYIVETK